MTHPARTFHEALTEALGRPLDAEARHGITALRDAFGELLARSVPLDASLDLERPRDPRRARRRTARTLRLARAVEAALASAPQAALQRLHDALVRAARQRTLVGSTLGLRAQRPRHRPPALELPEHDAAIAALVEREAAAGRLDQELLDALITGLGGPREAQRRAAERCTVELFPYLVELASEAEALNGLSQGERRRRVRDAAVARLNDFCKVYEAQRTDLLRGKNEALRAGVPYPRWWDRELKRPVVITARELRRCVDKLKGDAELLDLICERVTRPALGLHARGERGVFAELAARHAACARDLEDPHNFLPRNLSPKGVETAYSRHRKRLKNA